MFVFDTGLKPLISVADIQKNEKLKVMLKNADV